MRIRLLLAAAVVAAAAAGLAGGSLLLGAAPEEAAGVQPIPFNHRVHVKDEEMDCIDCHDAATSARAGIADIKSCNECHKDPQGEPPTAAEEKVREYAKAKKQIPWVQVNKNVGHVYFSHRAHVSFGAMKCEECHGDIGSMETPVATPNPELHSMKACIKCHESRGVTTDCLACHK